MLIIEAEWPTLLTQFIDRDNILELKIDNYNSLISVGGIQINYESNIIDESNYSANFGVIKEENHIQDFDLNSKLNYNKDKLENEFRSLPSHQKQNPLIKSSSQKFFSNQKLSRPVAMPSFQPNIGMSSLDEAGSVAPKLWYNEQS